MANDLNCKTCAVCVRNGAPTRHLAFEKNGPIGANKIPAPQ